MNYEAAQKKSRELIALALDVADTGIGDCWNVAWSIAKQDSLMVQGATQEAWTAWAKNILARRRGMKMDEKFTMILVNSAGAELERIVGADHDELRDKIEEWLDTISDGDMIKFHEEQ